MSRRFKILSLDGGGVRGVIQARILQRLEVRIGRKLEADLVVGTSAGSFLALGYQDYNYEDVLKIYTENAEYIFGRHRFLDDAKALWGLIGSRHKNEPLKNVLTSLYGEKKLKDLDQKVLVTTLNLNSDKGYWHPEVLTNLEGPYFSPDVSLVDAAMRSSASPVFLPIYQNYCDGGVWGNNPSASGLAAVCDKRVLGKNLEDCVVLSIGTGRETRKLDCPDGNFGALQWFVAGILQLLFYGNMDATHYYSESFLGDRYFRMQTSLGGKLSKKLFDDYKTIPDLIKKADEVDIEPMIVWLEEHWL